MMTPKAQGPPAQLIAMLEPARLSTTDWEVLTSGAERAARQWMENKHQASGACLLVLINGCLQCPEPTLAAAKLLLASQELEHAQTFRHRQNQAHHLLARAGLRLLLAAITGEPPQQLAIERSPTGKPFLARSEARDHSPEFNIAHSHDLVLIGLHHTDPIGVDLEAHRPLPDCLAIAKRCFDGETVRQLAALNGEQQLHAFYSAWCQLEADRKATGHGLARTPPAQIDLQRLPIAVPVDYSGWVSILPEKRIATLARRSFTSSSSEI